jgi:cytochrome P450 family 109
MQDASLSDKEAAGMTFNPLDSSFHFDPYTPYQALREQRAVWVESLKAWFVGNYDDVAFMSTNHKIFSQARFSEISKGEFDYAPRARQLISSDPPVHTPLRKLVGQGFKPARIRAMEEDIAKISQQYISKVAAAKGTFDFQHDLAERVPIHVIANLLGVPAEHGDTFKRWTGDIMSASNRATMNEEQLKQIATSVSEAQHYFLDVIEERRKKPGDDMISVLLAAQDGDERLTEEEVMALSILLLIGGDETTAHLLGNTMLALWENPDQFDLVRADRSRIPALIEESLRYNAPVQTVFWTTTEDVQLGDAKIAAEDAVMGVWGSANRDPERFRNPDQFDITRDRGGHLAFGFGPHFCIGAMLARVEARIVLDMVFDELPNLRRADDGPVDWVPSYWLRGPHSLMVTA